MHRHLCDMVAGGAPTDLAATIAAKILAKVRPAGAVQAERQVMARELLVEVRRLDRSPASNEKCCKRAIAMSRSPITDIHGIGLILAVKILGYVGDIGRFPTQ